MSMKAAKEIVRRAIQQCAAIADGVGAAMFSEAEERAVDALRKDIVDAIRPLVPPPSEAALFQDAMVKARDASAKVAADAYVDPALKQIPMGRTPASEAGREAIAQKLLLEVLPYLDVARRTYVAVGDAKKHSDVFILARNIRTLSPDPGTVGDAEHG